MKIAVEGPELSSVPFDEILDIFKERGKNPIGSSRNTGNVYIIILNGLEHQLYALSYTKLMVCLGN